MGIGKSATITFLFYLSHLTNGMYLIRIITDDETRLIKLRKE